LPKPAALPLCAGRVLGIRRANSDGMMRGLLVCLALASAAVAGPASTPPSTPLGLDYSQYGPYGVIGPAFIAADSTGALYTMMSCPANEAPTYCVTKLSADGATILWQNHLGFAGAMAVDPTGGVYVAGDPNAQFSSLVVVEKLNADGSGVAWQTVLNGTQANGAVVSLAVDSTGRAFVTCLNAGGGGEVVRVNASGGIDFVLKVPIVPGAIAVDPTGADVVVAAGAGLARLAPDGVTWLDVTLPQPLLPPFLALAVAANGDAAVYGRGPEWTWILQRVDPEGKVVFSNAIPGSNAPISPLGAGLALDAAGNAYITGYSGSTLLPVRNSIAPCGTAWLSVFAPDGSILQTTYLPGAGLVLWGGEFSGMVAVSADSSVFGLYPSDGSTGPTRSGPFPAWPAGAGGSSAILFHLSPNAGVSLAPLACVGNAATFAIGPVAPGELVALYGSGLGPQQGVQTQATLTTPFPTQAAGVEVTFDGTPAPLMWVQDAQINLAVPWPVSGPATKVCVTYHQVRTNCLSWPVAAVSPGVFTTDGVHAAAWNQDGTFNSAANPATGNSDRRHAANALPDSSRRRVGDLRWHPGAAIVGAGRSDQRRGAVVRGRAHHRDLRDLQRRRDQLPELGGGAGCAGSLYHRWHRGSSESGWNAQLGGEPGGARFHRDHLRHRSGADQSAAGRWHAGGAAASRGHAAARTVRGVRFRHRRFCAGLHRL
jgi:hypothetical protein